MPPEEEECDPDADDYEECVAAKAKDEEDPGWVPVAPKKSADAEAIAASQATSDGVVEMISDAAWDGSAGRFTPEQWKKSTVLHVCTGDEKSCHKLPIREPGGALSAGPVCTPPPPASTRWTPRPRPRPALPVPCAVRTSSWARSRRTC